MPFCKHLCNDDEFITLFLLAFSYLNLKTNKRGNTCLKKIEFKERIHKKIKAIGSRIEKTNNFLNLKTKSNISENSWVQRLKKIVSVCCAYFMEFFSPFYYFQPFSLNKYFISVFHNTTTNHIIILLSKQCKYVELVLSDQ